MVVWLSLFGGMFLLAGVALASSAIGWEAGTYLIFALPVMFLILFGFSMVMGIVAFVNSVSAAGKAAQLQRQSPAGEKTKIPVTPPTTGLSLGTASSAVTAVDRQVRARQGDNFTVPRRKSFPAAIWVPFLIAVSGFGLIWIGGGANTLGFAPPLTGVGVAMFVGGIGWVMVRAMLPSKQIRAYRKKYAHLDVGGAETRSMAEPLRGQSAHQIGGTGPWNDAMWDKYGKVLLGREQEMREHAGTWGGEYAPLLTEGGDDEVINPNLRPDLSSGLWQVRNVIVLPDRDTGDYPVQVADLNSLSEVRVNKQPSPTLFTSTYAETWFPSDHQLAVYPNKANIANEWRHFGAPVTPLDPHLDKLYDVRATDDFWARLVLNVVVMEKLVNLHPVVLLIDQGKITLARPGAWVEPDELKAFVETVSRIARSAKAAEA